MMDYEAKSLVIGRKKKIEDDYPVFVSLFNINDPHLTNEVPIKMFDFSKVKKIIIDCNTVEYWPYGSDIVINNLKSVSIEQNDDILTIKGK